MVREKHKAPRLFYSINVDELIPEGHFLRKLDRLLNKLELGKKLHGLYASGIGRPAIDPEVMIRILLLGYLYGLSENRLFQELRMHLGYRWFCGLEPDDRVPDRTTLNKLRNHRWAKGKVVEWLMEEIVQRCIDEGLVQGERLGIDGTQVRANASIQSFEPIELHEKVEDYLKRLSFLPGEAKEFSAPTEDLGAKDSGSGGSSEQTQGKVPRGQLGLKEGHPKKPGDFHGEKLSNQTHRSLTDPDALLFRKGANKEAHLSYLMHDVVELDSGVILSRSVTQAIGALERQAALVMLDSDLSRYQNITFTGAKVEGDKNYCTKEFIFELRQRGYKPRLAVREDLKEQVIPQYKRAARDPVLREKREHRKKVAMAVNEFLAEARSPSGKRERRHRINIERIFAEAKALGMARTRYRGLEKVARQAMWTACVQNIRRLIRYLDRKGPRAEAAVSFFRNIFLKLTHFLRVLDYFLLHSANLQLGSLDIG